MLTRRNGFYTKVTSKVVLCTMGDTEVNKKNGLTPLLSKLEDTSQRPKYCPATDSCRRRWSDVHLRSNMLMRQVMLRQWLDQSEAPEHFPKRKSHQKRVTLSVWWVASGAVRYNIWNPTEIILSQKYCYDIDKTQQERQSSCLNWNHKELDLLHDNTLLLLLSIRINLGWIYDIENVYSFE